MPLQISRILHAGYLFECDAVRIAFDTIFENPFSRNCHAFPAVRFDAVFISHFHDDHCSLDSLDLLDRATPIYMYCLFDELFDMVRALGFTKVQPLRIDAAVRVGPFTVTPRIAMDPDVDSMFQVEAAGMKVLNVVDSWIDPDTLPALAAYGPWDMVLWPFQTMREIEVLSPSRATPAPAALPEEWIAQLRVLNPRHVVPSSCQFLQEPWSWYNHAFFPITYRQFQLEIEAALPAARVVRMNPGVTLRLDADGVTPAPALDWIIPVGEQDLDYAYDPVRAPPTTGEIARHFAPLDAAQAARLTAYCGSGLLERYRGMELPEDSYFEQPRLWRLSMFDHDGSGTHWHYRVQGDSIEPVAADAGPLSWTTEIPAAKLYAALELGESLTSMYMRINDQQFDDATERDLETAELVDDPLIRCLFNDAFGAYQAAQLRRLKAMP
jgi:hypothetical protein